jgi:hypothetical protein
LILEEFSLKLADLQSSFNGLEQKMLFEKQGMVLAEKAVEENTQLFINSGLYRWCVYVLLVIIAYYLGCYLYAQFLNVSIWTFLPKIPVPCKFLPFLEKEEFFEFILGEFTIRLKVNNGNVIFSEAKNLSEMCYKPLEDLLNSKSDVTKDIVEQTSSLFLDPAPVTAAATNGLDPGAVTAAATNAEILNSVFSVL